MNVNAKHISNCLDDNTIKMALVYTGSYVNDRAGYAKAFFLLQMGKFVSTLVGTLAITHRSIQMNTPKISTLIHSTLIRGHEV